MGFFDGGAGAATITAVGNLVSNWQNSRYASSAREWQKGMSNTAHQREVKDLRKAGLNPILSSYGGDGASTPMGAVAHAGSIAEGVPEAYYNARRFNEIEKQQIENETALKDSQTELNKSQEELARESIKTAATQQTLNSAGALYQLENAKTAKAHAALFGATALKEMAAADQIKVLTDISKYDLYDKYGDWKKRYGKGNFFGFETPSPQEMGEKNSVIRGMWDTVLPRLKFW